MDPGALMHAAIKVRELGKIYALSEHGGGPVSLLAALRAGKNETKVREVRALDGISFDVVEGERVGIIGPNGAGKTTLLSILAGIAAPTFGTVEVEGDVHAMLSIGAVLREDLTGWENIDLDASVHGRRQAEIDAVREQIISFSDLGDFIDRPVHTYSSGMRGRLAFSMGAFINPDILIIDETLSVGDFFFNQKASRRMKEVAASGRIVILVSHGLGSVVEMCSRCLWIDRGRIVMDGDPNTVTSAYEASVREADEASLARKFGEGGGDRIIRSAAGELAKVTLAQNNTDRQATVMAMRPLEIGVAGTLKNSRGPCGLSISVLRVDGRLVWQHSSIEAGLHLPDAGPFKARAVLDPFILGADLYRLEVSLIDQDGILDRSTRVFEVVDEEGQHGGKPLLLLPPRITVRPIAKVSS
jgi:lipopolysaccharide transport system ATP-binding protein